MEWKVIIDNLEDLNDHSNLLFEGTEEECEDWVLNNCIEEKEAFTLNGQQVSMVFLGG